MMMLTLMTRKALVPTLMTMAATGDTRDALTGPRQADWVVLAHETIA